MPVLITREDKEILLKKELERIERIIIKDYDPLKIIIFGSLVEGIINEGSDIDILIIKDTPKRPIDRCIELANLTRPNVGVDFFVYTPQEIKYFLKEKYSFLVDVLNKGKILYEKRNARLA